ncbi:MAG: hypothetical protein LBE12_00120 [Planctomycetaceae bacterium]|nr:hypothetical protein [Planctomycetaceae bacterium]
MFKKIKHKNAQNRMLLSTLHYLTTWWRAGSSQADENRNGNHSANKVFLID